MIILALILMLVIVVILILLLKPLKSFVKELKGKEYLISDTYNRVSKMGPVTSINGYVGAGKTLTAVCMVQMKTLVLQDKLNDRLNNIIDNYVKLDFNNINDYLDNYFNNLGNKKYDNETLYNELFGAMSGTNFDFLNMRSIKKDLSDYIDFYYILNFRCNYIISNFYVFSRVTMSVSKVLDQQTLELKNLYKTMNYSLDRALFIVNDEQNVENGNVNSNSKDMKTSGRKELLSLIRNIYEGLTEVITTKQIHEDEFIGTRRLEVTKLDVNDCKTIIYNFQYLHNLIDKWLKFKYWLFGFWYMFIPMKKKRERKIDEKYKKANNKYRKKVFFWTGVKNFLNSQGLLVINVDITENKKTTEGVDLFFPLKFGYGTYDTHDYSCVRKELEKMSRTSFIETENNIRFNTFSKIKQKSKFLYENKEKQDNEKKQNEEREVIEVCI